MKWLRTTGWRVVLTDSLPDHTADSKQLYLKEGCSLKEGRNGHASLQQIRVGEKMETRSEVTGRGSEEKEGGAMMGSPELRGP